MRRVSVSKIDRDVLNDTTRRTQAFRDLAPQVREIAISLLADQLDLLASDAPITNRDFIAIRGRIQNACELAQSLRKARQALAKEAA